MGTTSFLAEAVRTGKSFLGGLGVTFREAVFEDPVTVQYPEERPELPAWFRGIPAQKTDLATGEYKCTSCGLCVEACPVNVITLEWHQNKETRKKEVDRYAIDMSRCMVCNYCIEACPFDSLVMAYDFELCKVNPENMLFEYEDLLRLGLKYSKAEEGLSKPAKGATPPWVFAELTNGTEADIQDPEGFLGRPPMDPKLKKARSGAAPAASAQATISKDTPVQTPPVNPNPRNVSAAAGPAKSASPKAEVASPQEAMEIRPDQIQPKADDKGGEGSNS